MRMEAAFILGVPRLQCPVALYSRSARPAGPAEPVCSLCGWVLSGSRGPLLTAVLCQDHQQGLHRAFVHICDTMSILCVCRDQMCSRTTDPRIIREARVCCEVPQGGFFYWLFMESVSEDYVEIYLDLASESLFRVGTSTGDSASVSKLQLINKHCSCLMVAVELLLPTGGTRVEGASLRVWEDFPEPSVKPVMLVFICQL